DARRVALDAERLALDAGRLPLDGRRIGLDAERFSLDARRLALDARQLEYKKNCRGKSFSTFRTVLLYKLSVNHMVASEEVFEHLYRCSAVHRSDGCRQRNSFRTCDYAVLRVAAFADATVRHNCFQTLIPVHC